MQRLLTRGLSASEIANSINPTSSETTVRRDTRWIRRMNEKWWRSNSQVEARMIRYMKERIDAMAEIAREGWLVVCEAKDDLKSKVSGLNVVLGAEKTLAELLGFAGMTMLSVELQEKLEVIDAELKGLRELADSGRASTAS